MRTTAIFCIVTVVTFTVFASVQIFQWADQGRLSHVLPSTIFRQNGVETTTTSSSSTEAPSAFNDMKRPTEIIIYPEMNPKAYRCSAEDPKPESYVNSKFTLDAVVNHSLAVVPPDAPLESIVQTHDREYLSRSNFSSVQFASVPEHYFSERHLLTNVIYSRWTNNKDRVARRKDLQDLTHGEIRPVFIVGLPRSGDQKDFCGNHDECINWLLSEQLENGDMLIVNMTDQYDLVSMKTTAMLQWVATMVPDGPEFVMKSDEDVVINYSVLVEDLIRRFPNGFKTFVYDGCLWYPWTMPVLHNKNHKNFEDVSFDAFPAYNSGPAYVLSNFAAKELYRVRTSTITRYFNNEDAMLGILTHFSSPDYHGVNDRKVYPIGADGVGFDCSDSPSDECNCNYWWAVQCLGKVKCDEVKKAAEACSHQRRSIFEQLDTMTSK